MSVDSSWTETLNIISVSNLEPTCLLVSSKTRSSGINNNQFPESTFRFHGACVPWFTWRPEIKRSMWMRSTKIHKGNQYALERLGKSKFDFEKTAVSNFKSERHEDSGSEIEGSGNEIDQSHALFDRVLVFTAQA